MTVRISSLPGVREDEEGHSRSKKDVFRSKGSLFRHQRDDLACKTVEFLKFIVDYVSRGPGQASIPSILPSIADGFRDKLGQFAPIADHESSIASGKSEKKVGNEGQFVTLTAKNVVNRSILIRFLARHGRVRNSSAKPGPSQSRIRPRRSS